MVTAPVRRKVVRAMVTRGLSERQVLRVIHMRRRRSGTCRGRIPTPAWVSALSPSRIVIAATAPA
jgi:hypothetical protein